MALIDGVHMKKEIVTALIGFSIAQAAILNVPLTVQKHSQWCWAGTTTAIIKYYGANLRQCDVANYARIQINATSTPFHNFGTTDCCADTTTFNMSQADGSCNYTNYNWGNPGSIQDILNHWNVTNGTKSGYYTQNEVNTEINAGHPFIIRYGWTAGGGHFIVGRGIVGNDMYLMNPWPGNEYEIVAYNTVVSASDHKWTHTNTISKAPPSSSGTTLSSSTALSSSLAISSSTIISSSSAQSSSSTISTGNCSGIPTWNSSTTYATNNTKVVYNNILWTNQWYANPGEQPGVNQVWVNQGNCSTTSSSSALSSSTALSSSVKLSSSSVFYSSNTSSSSLALSSSTSSSSSIAVSSSSSTVVATLDAPSFSLATINNQWITWNGAPANASLTNAAGTTIAQGSNIEGFHFETPLSAGFYALRLWDQSGDKSWWLSIK